METTTDLLSRAQAASARGRAWRAKEILRGNIASGRVEPEVLEAYGLMLETLGERAEAGKYLFLSGAHAARYSEAISVFKRRTANRRGADLVAQFPAGVRRRPFHELAPSVQHELLAMGVTPELFGTGKGRAPMRSHWRERLAMAGWLMACAVLLLAMLLGLKSMGSWLWSRLA